MPPVDLLMYKSLKTIQYVQYESLEVCFSEKMDDYLSCYMERYSNDAVDY